MFQIYDVESSIALGLMVWLVSFDELDVVGEENDKFFWWRN